MLDLLGYPDCTVIQSLYLSDLMAAQANLKAAQFYRFRINLDNQHVRKEILFDSGFELPRINYRKYNSKKYQYVYTVGQEKDKNYLTQLNKLDVSNGNVLTWQEIYVSLENRCLLLLQTVILKMKV